MSIRIEVLNRSHRSLLADFQNQQASLVEYLKRYALRHGEKDLLARTYVALDEGVTTKLAGYFTLAASSVERSSVARLPALEKLPRFPIPAVLLARLAVDSRVQGQGLGRYLFEEALGLTLQLAQTGPVGFRVLVTDALDARAARFYSHFGLEQLGEQYPCRMVLDVKRLFEPSRP
jgi:GNAT superfamily N-acetyltransferase